MSTVQHQSPAFLEGAQNTLSILQRLPSEQTYEESLEQMFAAKDAAIAQLVTVAGPTSDQANGVLTLLAELVFEMCAGMPFQDIQRWRPETLLSPQKKEAERKDCLEGN